MQQRPRMFALRVNRQEDELIRRAAALRGLTLSDYVRELLVDNSRLLLEMEAEKELEEGMSNERNADALG